MDEARGSWHDFGRLPALAIVIPFYAVALVVGLALDASFAWLVAAAFVILLLHCFARPRGGFDLFCFAAAPGAIGNALASLADTPRTWGFFLIPVALYFVWQLDRRDGADEPEPQALA